MFSATYLLASLCFLESTSQLGAKIHGCIFEVILNKDVNMTGPVT